MGQAASAMFPTVAQQEQQQQDDSIPWHLRYGARLLGVVGSIISMGLGLWVIISFSPICIFAGIFQMLAGFIVIVIEAPCCCLFLDQVQQLSVWFDNKPYWHKALFYMILSLPPIILCAGIGTIFGSGFVFLTAVLYGTMTLGKKASRDEMMRRAAGTSGTSQINLVESGKAGYISPAHLPSASREEMMSRAQSDQQINQEMKANLMNDQNFGGGPGGEMGGLHQI